MLDPKKGNPRLPAGIWDLLDQLSVGSHFPFVRSSPTRADLGGATGRFCLNNSKESHRDQLPSINILPARAIIAPILFLATGVSHRQLLRSVI
jgi:hypothetical protein